MARKTANRMELRKQAEAAAERKTTSRTKRTTKRTTKSAKRSTKRSKPAERRRLVWVIYSGSWKPEARFPYDQREEAEKRLEQLRAKSKKLYFIQPVKEVITEEEKAAAEAAETESAQAEAE